MSNKMLPINEKERYASIDILRGIAILGIFLVNMPSFYSPFLYLNPETYWDEGIDRSLDAFVDIVAQGSFYPLFAFLFGYGAIMIAERSKIKNLSFPWLFTKRLFVLLVLGSIHAFLIWHGDILITYAITGFMLMLFYKCKGKTLIITALLLYIIPFGLLSLVAVLLMPGTGLDDLYNSELVLVSLQVYSEGSFSEITAQRFADWMVVNGPGSIFILVINILPLMLLGAAFAKQGWLVDVKKHKKLLIGFMLVGLIGGLFLKVLPYIQGFDYGKMLMQDQFGGPLLTLFYISAIVLAVQKKQVEKFLKPLAYVGRMSLSNYLLQSIVFTLVFYGYGFGLYGSISYLTGFIILLVFYGLQVLLSKWWISRYQYGPVEYVWRWGTYGHKPQLKRRSVTNETRNSGMEQ